MQYIDVVVGGQYGSEAKGHVTAQLVKNAAMNMRAQVDAGTVINIRVAGPNAGHTVYDAEGNKFAFRSLPVGAVVDPEVALYIAPGSEIDLAVLEAEMMEAQRYGHETTGRLFISRQATVIDGGHKLEEQALVGNIGSTGKGIGAARAARLLRTARTMGEAFEDRLVPWEWAEPEDLYASDDAAHNESIHIIVEGTQGFGLSLRASGHYPWVTSSDARSIDFLSMAGIDPTRCGVTIQNWVVARVFPIRVAGNSGPMLGETSWEDLGLAEEFTTVTQKVRRVGEWDLDLLQRAVQANGGHKANVVITMLDQVVPELTKWKGITLGADDEIEQPEFIEDADKAIGWINDHVEGLGARVAAFTFSPVDILFTPQPQVDEPIPADVAAAMEAFFADLNQQDEVEDQGRTE